ncbi:hypothetical protein [Acinetobacter johnsonii]|uniref:hypothetical protein n=1 Tax=Acinetobacter johnsonii TaxID=40214 RepID=UPI003AF5D2B4
MKKATLVHPLMSEAFLIWLAKLGYKGVARAGVISFYHEINNRNFPRGVMILEVISLLPHVSRAALLSDL